MIKLVNVSKKYDDSSDYVIENLNLEIKEGELCAFIGPSGCGKSTTLKMINRLIDITSGNIYIDGVDIRDKDENLLRMNIGYVIQQIGLLPHKTVFENISIVPRLFGWSESKIEKRVEDLLIMVGLDPSGYKDKYPRQLSGGQMQRVGVARALAADPPIMLMDEPFGAVDPITRKYIQDEFLNLQKKIKKTICFVTHDIDEAIKMGDRIAIFNNKNIVQIDTPKNILLNPADDFVKEFIGANRLSKSYDLFLAEDVINYLSKNNKLRKSEPGISVNIKNTISDVLNIMMLNNTDDINVELNGNIIGNISFKEISCYLSEVEGE